ncbi:molt-inhibiting hormone-like [Macrobrachium rosenbergii]|uniref:Molt inhibiting hormone-like protein n=1 Tax=Macrobrachium rosenbergii TaxID=79674 RepID=Q8WRN6_MACRS|nr:sinus gland peptide A precursor [Macrobrachium rosenbergii]AGN90993.1 molt inhibiting hormone-like protein [Macrobrachium rosenbergii]
MSTQKGLRGMVNQTTQGISAQRVLVTALVIISLFLVSGTSARYLDDECPGVMGNRDLYEKVVRVCDDCSNIFRMNDMGTRCRKDCFYNVDFLWCVYATERHGDVDQLNRWMSILRAGRK